MKSTIAGLLIVVVASAILVLPVAVHAQEVLTGTVKDATGGVLPGVTVTGTLEATGNTFVAVTDGEGVYRLAVRPGIYGITAELAGFTTLTRAGVEVLVGQRAVVNLELAVSSQQESLTVTGEPPILDTTGSTVGSNINPRQMQELPLQGRNWMDLTLLAAGSRSNAATAVPQDRQGFFQINVDGQQVTNLISQPQASQVRISRDAMAEFQLISNRFDATMGRSQGMVVNAVTRSGTNVFAGTLSGYFRDDSLMAADFIQQRVVPFSNQQVSTTFGGPIRQNRVHFFAAYEYEREPKAATFSSSYPSFNIDLPGNASLHSGLGRGDIQFSPNSRLSLRHSTYRQVVPNQATGGASAHPSTGYDIHRMSDQLWIVQTQVLSNRTLNEIKGGWGNNRWFYEPLVRWNGGGPFGNPDVLGGGTVRIDFSGYSIGTPANAPQDIQQAQVSIRDDLTTSFELGGRHDVKVGGEYFRYQAEHTGWCNRCNGVLRINGRPPANIEQLFPVWNDPSTWNLAPLSPLVIDYQQSVGDFHLKNVRHMWAGWLQDDWKPSDKLTLNLGVRYDLDIGAQGEQFEILPFESGNRPSDYNNVGPRLGFAYQFNDRTVMRGGYGMFFTQLENDGAHQTQLWGQTLIPQLVNDRRPDFASNPFNGPKPTYDQVLANACDKTNNRPGCVRRQVTIEIPAPSEESAAPLHSVSYSHMASIGVQRQIGETMSFEVNFVWTGGRAEESTFNMNIAYNPATGANYPFTDLSRLPFPDWGAVLGEFMVGRSDYRGLEMSFNRRFSKQWQAGATYALSDFRASQGNPVQVMPDGNGSVTWQPLGFAVAPDLGEDYDLAAGDQRHRATFNGVWVIGAGFEMSGLYFFGSGQRYATTWGGDLRNLGVGSKARLRPDGTITPLAGLVGDPSHRVDLRLKKRVSLGGKKTLDGLVEIFNVFNHANYGSYVTAQSNAAYGQPQYSANAAHLPRSVQLGFRLAF